MPRCFLNLGSTTNEIKDAATALGTFDHYLGGLNTVAGAGGEATDSMWSLEQLKRVAALAQSGKVKVIREVGEFDKTGRYIDAPIMVPVAGQTITADDLDLLFTKRVNEAWPAYEKRYGKKPDTPLLVGINTVDVLLLSLGTKYLMKLSPPPEELLDAFIERTRQEVEEIWKLTEGNVAFMVESPMANILMNMLRGKTKLASWFIQAFKKLVAVFPKGAKWGFHFCTGRVGNKAMFTRLRKLVYNPKRTVAFSNRLFAALAEDRFIPSFVHYPFRLGKRKPSRWKRSYKAYKNIKLDPSTLVFAGAIDPRLPDKVQQRIYRYLDEAFGRMVGVAATCGFGSMTLEEMVATLRCMRRTAFA